MPVRPIVERMTRPSVCRIGWHGIARSTTSGSAEPHLQPCRENDGPAAPGPPSAAGCCPDHEMWPSRDRLGLPWFHCSQLRHRQGVWPAGPLHRPERGWPRGRALSAAWRTGHWSACRATAASARAAWSSRSTAAAASRRKNPDRRSGRGRPRRTRGLDV